MKAREAVAQARQHEGGVFHLFPEEAHQAQLVAALMGEAGFATHVLRWQRKGKTHTLIGVGTTKRAAEQDAMTFMLHSTF